MLMLLRRLKDSHKFNLNRCRGGSGGGGSLNCTYMGLNFSMRCLVYPGLLESLHWPFQPRYCRGSGLSFSKYVQNIVTGFANLIEGHIGRGDSR